MAIRFTGLASGLDTEAIITQLMQTQRMSLNNIWKKKTQLEWKKADYNVLYNAIKDFRDNFAFNYRLDSTLLSMKTSSSDESKVTAKANGDAVAFTHNITVYDLAQGASMTSSANISQVGSAGKTTLADHIGISGEITLTISDGTTTKTLDNTGNGTYDTTGKSIYDLVSDINKLGLNVKASYDSTLDRFFLSNTQTGAANQITLTSADGTGTGAGSLMDKLQIGAASVLTTDAAAVPVLPDNIVSGQDARFKLDGVELTQSTNTFAISGVTYNLKSLGTTQITISHDTDKAVESMKAFVEAYNALLEQINGKLKETSYRDFLPLTDDEKSALKDSQITMYEEKARSGIFRNDTILTNLVSQMRSSIYSSVSGIGGKYTTLSSIGITTSANYTEGGKLYLDENKLRTALTEDPEVLKKLFATDGATSSKDGVAVRLQDNLKTALDNIITAAGYSSASDDSALGKSINNYDKRISDMEVRLRDVEDRYYRQFTAMEKALQQLNAQSSWLTSLLDATSSSKK